jgi:glycosyltransferase involved in cell wall biosynthesis
MPHRRILVVSYYFPPTTTVGGHRWHAMCRHLQRLGHETLVVTTGAEAAGPDDRALGVVRVADLVASPALRRVLRRPPLAASAQVAADAAASPQLEKPAPALLTRVVVPDSYLVSWMPAALVATRRLIGERAIDVVVTTGPPHSTHAIGLMLGRRAPLWLADFRDGWGFEPLGAPWPTAPQRALDRALERRVVARADAVLGATRPIADDLADRLGGRASWVPNGWDPDRAPDGSATAPPGNPTASRDTVTLVHTGKLSGPRGRDPRPLFAALRALRAEGPVGGRRDVRLVLAGQMDARDQALIAESGLGDAVEHVGVLDRRAVVVLQRDADALLLLTALQRNASEATGKVFEYLASGRPIVALAHENEAARIVGETRTGVVVPPDDEAAILEALRQMADGKLTRDYAPRALERFTYPGPALAVLDAVEQAERLRG